MAMSKKNQNILLVAMIFAVSMTTIDQTIVALSADTIQSELGISHAAITWSINAYILATAAFFLLGGKLADTFGHRRMVVVGILGFTLFSLLNSLTPAGEHAATWLIASRTLQGVFTALMFPAALGIVLAHFPTSSRGKAVATFFAVTGAMTALGPFLGGYLTEWTWRSIFWINIPIAIGALILLAHTTSSSTDKPAKRQPIDWGGAALIASSMGLSITGFQQAGSWGWSNIATWAFICAGLLLFAIFIAYERRQKTPILDLTRFKSRPFNLSILAVLFSSMAFIPIFFFMSVYAQVSLGLSVNASGLLLLEFFLGFMIAARLGGNLFDVRGAKLPLIIGGAVGAAGFAWWSTKLHILTDGAGFLESPQFWPTVMAGAGLGFMFSAVATDIANRSSANSYGEATAISQTAKNFGGALGLAVLATVLTTNLTHNMTNSFQALGAPASAAKQVANDISSGTAEKNNHTNELPQKVQEEFELAAKESYAESTKPVFYGMSAAMAVVFLIGLAYPREH